MSKYKGLKIATVNGQGAEGCGVQRTSGELQLWAKRVGATVDFYSLDFKKYSRGKGHDMSIIPFSVDEIPSIGQKLNDDYDIVMFMSYPHNKFPHDVSKSFYYELYEKIQKPQKAVYIHEIHKLNIDKVMYLVPMICNADIVFHFDTNTWFSNTVDSLGFQKKNDRLHKYTLWMNFEELDEYRQKYKDDKDPGLVSVTRWSSLKNIRRSIDIMDNLQKINPEASCKVHGVERSIGAKFDILDYDKTIYVNPKGNKDNEELGTVCVHGPVERNKGLDLVASHMFSSSFFSLPKATFNYGNRMEYTQIEIVGVGTIPIFDKNWAEFNHTKDGRRYIDIPYSAIYTDGTDTKEVAEKLNELYNNKEEAQKYLDTSYQLVNDEFNANHVIPDAIDLIKSVGKNKNQRSVYQICEDFVNTEMAEGIDKLEKDGKIPVLGIGEFETPVICHLEGSKENVIKKLKFKKGDKKTKKLF